jgi:hypothetical protein
MIEEIYLHTPAVGTQAYNLGGKKDIDAWFTCWIGRLSINMILVTKCAIEVGNDALERGDVSWPRVVLVVHNLQDSVGDVEASGYCCVHQCT